MHHYKTSEKNMTYAVIMAGGVGTRFWPQSREARPKQFLNLFGQQTMLQQTVSRILPLVPMERVLVVTNARYRDLVKEQLPGILDHHVIGEPLARNTAPCVAAAAAYIEEQHPGATMIVLPSDHLIADEATFRGVLEAGIRKAEQGQHLVTIGIKPYRPETGYGYIQFEQETADKGMYPVHQVRTFAEKPDYETAVHFLQSGDFLWNSGMFIWRSDTILAEIQQHLPQIHAEVGRLRERFAAQEHTSGIDYFYRNVLSISIDYGVMEKAETVHVIKGDFGWNDVGSWLAVYELADKDASGNAFGSAKVLPIGVNNCFVSAETGKLIALVGVDGLTVVDTPDALMICKTEYSQDVKKVVESLEKEGFGDLK